MDAYTTPERWPWPGDSKLGQIQRIARSYRSLCEHLIYGCVPDPKATLAAEDAEWKRLGHHWVNPSITTPDEDEWLTAREAAHYVSQWYPCTERDIYKWAQRDNIVYKETPTATLYSWYSILRYDQQRTRRTAS